ncbi:MAG: hypothetical protein ACE5JR_04055 [Gemmatimonadota bacterium]
MERDRSGQLNLTRALPLSPRPDASSLRISFCASVLSPSASGSRSLADSSSSLPGDLWIYEDEFRSVVWGGKVA